MRIPGWGRGQGRCACRVGGPAPICLGCFQCQILKLGAVSRVSEPKLATIKIFMHPAKTIDKQSINLLGYLVFERNTHPGKGNTVYHRRSECSDQRLIGSIDPHLPPPWSPLLRRPGGEPSSAPAARPSPRACGKGRWPRR